MLRRAYKASLRSERKERFSRASQLWLLKIFASNPGGHPIRNFKKKCSFHPVLKQIHEQCPSLGIIGGLWKVSIFLQGGRIGHSRCALQPIGAETGTLPQNGAVFHCQSSQQHGDWRNSRGKAPTIGTKWHVLVRPCGWACHSLIRG